MGNQHLQGEKVGLISDPVLVIKVFDARFLRIVSCSLFVAVALFAFSFFVSLLKGSIVSELNANNASWSVDVDVLNSILHDLGEEGFLKKEDKALIMSLPPGYKGDAALLNWNTEVDMVMDESYDFVFTPRFEDVVFADHFLKINGIVVFPLDFNPSNAGFKKQSNYRFVYLKRYGSIFVALRKIGVATNNLEYSSPKRKLLQFATEAKTIALKGLEDPLVEHKAAIEWFQRNYPKKSTKFHIHSHVIAPKHHALQTENYPKNSAKFHIHSHVVAPKHRVLQTENHPKRGAKFNIHSHVVAPKDHVLQTGNYPKKSAKFHIRSHHVVAPKDHLLQTEKYPKMSRKFQIHSHVVAPKDHVQQAENYPKISRKFQIHSHVVAPKDHVLQTEDYPEKSTKLHIHSHVVTPN